jgi:hypothetical protein
VAEDDRVTLYLPQTVIVGILNNADGTPADGRVIFTPSEGVTYGNVVIPRTGIVGVLDSQGRLVTQALEGFSILPTDVGLDEGDSDEGPVTSDAFYVVTLDLVGQRIQEFRARVPTTTTATDSQALAASAGLSLLSLGEFVACQAMVGATVTGTGIAGSTTVESFDHVANTLTLSALTTGAVDGVTLTGCIDLPTLMDGSL